MFWNTPGPGKLRSDCRISSADIAFHGRYSRTVPVKFLRFQPKNPMRLSALSHQLPAPPLPDKRAEGK